MLKIFLQSFRMQFIFRSFAYERQKEIVDLLITGVKGGVFEPQITLNIPYSISGLSILFEKYKVLTHQKQAKQICTDLMKSLTQDHLYTFYYSDREIAEDLIEKSESGLLLHQNPETKDVMEKLLLRIRKARDDNTKNHDTKFLSFQQADLQAEAEKIRLQ